MTDETPTAPDLEAAALDVLGDGRLTDSEGLLAAASELLDAAGVAADDGRVAERLTARTLRYYRSLGLVDPPAARQANTNLFARRHALQLVAARAVQAAERAPIAELQRRLHGASDAELAASFAAAARHGPVEGPPAAQFWAHPAPAVPPRPDAEPAVVVAAAPGVTVTLTGPARHLDPTAVADALAALFDHPPAHDHTGDPR